MLSSALWGTKRRGSQFFAIRDIEALRKFRAAREGLEMEGEDKSMSGIFCLSQKREIFSAFLSFLKECSGATRLKKG